jgi:hypothetical protein
MKRSLFTILYIPALFFMACVEPFDPPEIASPERIIVIEATVDAPSGDARVVLSEIQNIASPPEDSLAFRISGAQVTIQSNNSTYTLPESEAGVYRAFIDAQIGTALTLQVNVNGNLYESDAVTILPTPPIDSLTYDAAPDGITFEVTTHDPDNSTKYYQWTYEETIQYRTQFISEYIYTGETVLPRTEGIFHCWKTIPSTSILTTTTEGLSDDVVYKFPLVYFPGDSWKKEIKYSLLVGQYAISKEAYLYLKELQTNTENLGSLFDPQPGRIVGNIRSVTDPEEYVIGYFNGRQRQEKRIFVTRQELPEYPRLPNICNLFEIDSLTVEQLAKRTLPLDLIGTIRSEFGTVIGYTTTGSARCLDCRILRDGTNIQPDFWE